MTTDSIKSWQQIMRLCCATQKTINITSYGDWDFTLSRKRKDQIARPINELIKQQLRSAYDYYDEQQGQKQIEIQQYLNYKNVQEALFEITVEINYTQQQFKEKYGFWNINNFKVYNRDGNGSYCSFQDENYFYYGSYCTS